VQQQCSTIKQCIYRAAKEITGTIQPDDRNQWFNQECSDATEMSNTLTNQHATKKDQSLN